MKKLVLFFTCILSFYGIAMSQPRPEGIVHGDLVVMCASEQDVLLLTKQLSSVNGTSTGLQLKKTLSSSMHIYLLQFDEHSLNENLFLAAVKRNSLVKIAQFNHIAQERIVPDDPQFASMWDMNNTGTSGTADADIDAPEAWDITTGGLTSDGDSIVVAIVDGGFDLTHQDLSYWKNYNEIAGNGIDDDGNGYVDDVKGWNSYTDNDAIPGATHGTHVAGAAGAKGNNGIGVSGVNWNVKIMPVSYGSAGSGTTLESNAIECYSYIRDQRKLYNQTNGAKGAFVVSTNSSFGIDMMPADSMPLWCAMYDSLGAVGILSAAATANANWNIDVTGDMPTSCTSSWLVTVTNTRNDDSKYPSAGYGLTTIDLGAPGTSTLSTLPGNSYGALTGTSMATPHVAGAIALMYSVPCTQFMINYKANPAGVALIIKDSLLGAVDPNNDLSTAYPTVTGGRLNLYKSVKAVQNYCAAVGVDELGSNNTVAITSVYPNPANDKLNIVYNCPAGAELLVTDVLGQEIRRIKTSSAQKSSIDVSGLTGGVYFISLIRAEQKLQTVKVIVY
jgi:hypothetical protein